MMNGVTMQNKQIAQEEPSKALPSLRNRVAKCQNIAGEHGAMRAIVRRRTDT